LVPDPDLSKKVRIRNTGIKTCDKIEMELYISAVERKLVKG
jgi:hypothetical protein